MTRPPPDAPDLAEETARRLILAGVTPGDPGLAAWHAWNAAVYARTAPEGPP